MAAQAALHWSEPAGAVCQCQRYSARRRRVIVMGGAIRHPGGATTIEPVHRPRRNRESRRPEVEVRRPAPNRALTSEAESRLRTCRRSPGSSDCQDLRCELRQFEALCRATRDRLRLRLPRDRLLRSLWSFRTAPASLEAAGLAAKHALAKLAPMPNTHSSSTRPAHRCRWRRFRSMIPILDAFSRKVGQCTC